MLLIFRMVLFLAWLACALWIAVLAIGAVPLFLELDGPEEMVILVLPLVPAALLPVLFLFAFDAALAHVQAVRDRRAPVA